MTAVPMIVSAPASRPRLLSGALARVFAADFCGLTSFYLLLSVVPQYATAIGVGGVGAGLATGVLMLSTVAAELVTPRLVGRFGYRTVLAAGLVLLGAPALAVPVSTGLIVILGLCALRGVGLAILFVVCGELGAVLVPADRRGEGLGLLGVVAGLPAVIAMPLGVWLVAAGYPVVFGIGALVALVGLVAVPGLPARRAEPSAGMAAGLRSPALVRPSIVFAGSAMAAGIVATFAPVVVPYAASALLAHTAAATLSRYGAGRYGDRHGASRLLVPGVVVAAAGMLLVALTGSAVAVLAGMVIFGAGFGTVQNASLAMMYDRVGPAGYGTASAVWNIAYDAGFGLGAAGFGVLAAQTGYSVGFAITAALIVAVLVVRPSR